MAARSAVESTNVDDEKSVKETIVGVFLKESERSSWTERNGERRWKEGKNWRSVLFFLLESLLGALYKCC